MGKVQETANYCWFSHCLRGLSERSAKKKISYLFWGIIYKVCRLRMQKVLWMFVGVVIADSQTTYFFFCSNIFMWAFSQEAGRVTGNTFHNRTFMLMQLDRCKADALVSLEPFKNVNFWHAGVLWVWICCDTTRYCICKRFADAVMHAWG